MDQNVDEHLDIELWIFVGKYTFFSFLDFCLLRITTFIKWVKAKIEFLVRTLLSCSRFLPIALDGHQKSASIPLAAC